ncbi:ABC transporter ATP-binding protein [Candidatus Azambacteria bacterium]|nr:ABC transporter ATP-binding protein [Candidatus Azambacteria bacterium]
MKTSSAIQLVIHNYSQQFFKDWRLTIPVFFLIGIGTILIFYVPPLIIAKLLTLLTTNQFSNNQIIYLIVFLGSVWLSGELFWRIGEHLKIKIQTNGRRTLGIEAINLLLEKDIAFFHDNFSGTLTSRVGRYGTDYSNIVEILIYQVFSQILAIVFITVILWHYSPILVFMLFGLTILAFISILPLIRRRKAMVMARETAHSALHGYTADIIGNIETVKSFAHEDFEIINHQIKVEDHAEKFKKAENYQNLYINSLISPFYVFTNVLGIAVAIFISRRGILPFEATFVTFSYYSRFTLLVWEFNHIYRGIEGNITEAAQFTELLLEPPKVLDQANPKKFVLKEGKIEFQAMGFAYHKEHFQQGLALQGETLFNNFNLKIKKGEKIGLVGHSGGGKTTITKLLLRLIDIQGGQILIDDQNIAEISQHDLRRVIAYVPQEPIMFHRSILDNIRYGQLDASVAEVHQAAHMANATEFIEKLPHTYETLVGERGIKLSGGQRQRIAIARAMLKNAPILVLDEATSALDSENEKLIQQALWKLIEGKTTIVIAHRLSTIQKMDRIVVLERGIISEEGSHQELLLKKGVYFNLWQHQSGGFLED